MPALRAPPWRSRATSSGSRSASRMPPTSWPTSRPPSPASASARLSARNFVSGIASPAITAMARIPAVSQNACEYDAAASAPAVTGPITFATSEDTEYAAKTGPPRPSTTSPTTAAGATSSNPEPNPSTAIATRKPGSDDHSANTTNANPDNEHPATKTGRRPTQSAYRPAGSSTSPLIPATHQNPTPVHTTLRCSTSATNSGISAARTPIDAHASPKFAASAARYAGIRSAAPSVVRPAAAAEPLSASGVERNAITATDPATARVPAYRKNGSRIDTLVTMPPTPGPAIPPSRNPPDHRPTARARCRVGTNRTSTDIALIENIADPAPPAPRNTRSCQ